MPGCKGFSWTSDDKSPRDIQFKKDLSMVAHTELLEDTDGAAGASPPSKGTVYTILLVALCVLFCAILRVCECPLYEPSQPWMAIRMSIIGCSVILIVCILLSLMLGSARGSPPPPPSISSSSECDSLCQLPRERYVKLDMCQQAHIDRWHERAKMKRRGRCKLDERTGLLACDDDFKCESSGGKGVMLVEVKRSAVYDCAKCNHNNEELRVQCCGMCREDFCIKTRAGKFQIADRGVDKVVCAGCDKNTLNKISNHETNFCKDNPGHFSCLYNASCQTGLPAERVDAQRFTCDCNPCGKCTDLVARAQCCVDCLSRTCALDGGTEHAKHVCSGCSLHHLLRGELAQGGTAA